MTITNTLNHVPVLLNEMLEALAPKAGGVYIDATFGGGGYTRAILNAAPCQVIALDRDPDAIERGQVLVNEYKNRLQLFQSTFSQLPQVLTKVGLSQVDGIVFDFGVSSFQLDQADRGFSFRFDGPLDMRMSAEGITASEVVNTFEEDTLADIIYRYGEEKKSRRIARAIVQFRTEQKIETTLQLASLIKKVMGHRKDEIHPATLTFQGLRIFINNELIEIEEGLNFSKNLLMTGGRLVAVTFHSLEDRLVKMFVREHSGRGAAISRYQPEILVTKPLFKDLYPKGITPSQEEISHNPRSRSARLRAAERLMERGM